MTEYAYDIPPSDTPHQGAVYRDVCVALLLPSETVGTFDLKKVELEYAVVMTQECDLAQDDKNRQKVADADQAAPDGGEGQDKFLPSVLVCPGYPSTRFRGGAHLSALKLKMRAVSSKEFDKIKKNRQLRYHYLSAHSALRVPEMVVDFKHIHTVSTELLRERYAARSHYLACLRCPYREDLSQRFAAYLSRVGLPVDHHRIGCAP